MAAAARVKPGGEAGVRIDNYAEEPLALKVTRLKPWRQGGRPKLSRQMAMLPSTLHGGVIRHRG